MRALLRVDASPAIGSGHLARCLTLATALRARGFDVDVATRAPSPSTAAWITRAGCGLVVVDGEEVDASKRAAEGAALVVIDGYAFGATLSSALRAPGRVVCVVDDLADAPIDADVVLDGNVYAEELAYRVPEGTTLLLGPAYALVRDDFVAARASRAARAASGGAPTLLVTMGGADPTGATEKVLASLARIGRARVDLVVGGANPRAEAIRALATTISGHDVEVSVDVADMGARMARCDLAISAAGSTCLELACVGVPAVVFAVADNQRLVADALSRRGMMVSLGAERAATPERIADAVNALLADPARALAMERAQRDLVDGRGKDRAAERLHAIARP